MRAFSIFLFLTILLISAASAELLTTANVIGQGRWAFLGAGIQDQNFNNNSSYSLTSIGGYVGYGITNQLDLLICLASANVGGLPAGMESTTTAYGANLKYTVLEEGAAMPVSVALGGGYRSMTTKVTGQADTPGSQIMLGAGVSKIIVPFIPYGAVAYRKNSSNGTETSTQIDATLGSALAWSEQGAILLEYTLQSITPNGGTAYSSGQIALGVGYKT